MTAVRPSVFRGGIINNTLHDLKALESRPMLHGPAYVVQEITLSKISALRGSDVHTVGDVQTPAHCGCQEVHGIDGQGGGPLGI